MENIGLLELGPPESFTDLHDIIKRHADQDLAWEAEISQISSMNPGKVNNFMEHPIKSLAFL